MKTINPFKRLNKEDFIPCSLFPASKVCDTSMDIGRATPLYCLDMVAGNRVSLDVSQLTRFQPMMAPVMTNYSVEFGAFFVPYVALDEFFSSTWFRTNCQNTDVQRKSVLRAREFFNPAIDNSEKVHPWMFTTRRCGENVKWVGSIYDHLRAPLGLPDWSTDVVYTSSNSTIDDTERVISDLQKIVTIKGHSGGTTVGSLFSSDFHPYASGSFLLDGKEVISPLSILVLNPQVVDNTMRSDFIKFVTTAHWSLSNGEGSLVDLVSVVNSDRTVDIGDYSVNGSINTVDSLAGAISSLYGLGTASFTVPSSISPHNWSPSRSSDNRLDIDAFVKVLWKTWFGYVPVGIFKVDAKGGIVYDFEPQALGSTVLSNLVDNLVESQLMPFVDKDSTVVPFLAMHGDKSGEFLSYPLWIAKHYGLLVNNPVFNEIVNSPSPTAALVLFFTRWKAGTALTSYDKYFARVMSSILFYFYGATVDDWTRSFINADVFPYVDLFGKNTIVQVQNAYRSYVESLWISANRNLEWNSVYWLCYHRIFADWFLNEHYTKHEDYLDLVGAAYIAGSESIAARDTKTMTDWFTPGRLSDGNNPKLAADPTLSYFGDRIAKGECMPVLWSLDSVTNLRQTTSTSSTPIGQSITENFYNRFYARFKDLINRMGPDYRRNARALYGKGPDDASLLRSQVVGYRSFDVQIGDVAQNSESTKDSTLGQFAGYAVSRDKAGSFDWTAQESGVFIVLAWVRPKYTCFADLVPRSLYKKEYMDYLIPQFGGVGYQDFAFRQLNPVDSNGDSRLGFEERYSEYMMLDNECSGLMRTSMAYYNSNRIGTPCYAPGTADFYHLLYMDEESDLKRVFVDNANDPILISAYFNGNVTRQLPATIKTEF